MSAQRITQTPLLPGIAPHLFQSRAPAHPHRNRIISQDTPESSAHPRMPSDDSTIVTPTLEDLQAELRVLRRRVETLETSMTWNLIQAAVQARLRDSAK
ncbi:hypothetical protein GGX14DRAFT_568270 [Mycena pura]|uniref:Uncharacterized protein n=1 Tax=Mycena pura TaxID=153505 RepID=A0AAD6Y7W3_9AGAR|nr:hypothetical protein GGX14DRAFT_568270 [Mycena pura]